MALTLYWVESDTTDPYLNLALEQALLDQVAPGECILYLWQNRRTVVLGRNQNPWRECFPQALREDGGFLARRLSGGGAVYHDLGNLNFTFLVHREHYDVEKQLEVLRLALEGFGLEVVKSGRNDLTIQGRKFSGNAFYQTGSRCYHHGTLMVDVDTAVLSRYLRVSPAKLQSKGVASVVSRVANLVEFAPHLTIPDCKARLLEAFGEVYGGVPTPLPPLRVPPEVLLPLEQRFASWEWLYGRNIPFQEEKTARFPWGEIWVRLQVTAGRVTAAACDSDALATEIIPLLAQSLEGCLYQPQALALAALSTPALTPLEEEIRRDVAQLLSQPTPSLS